METTLSLARVRLAGACVLATVLSQAAYAASPADSSQPVQSVWQPVEIKYSYVGFTTAYNCDSFESKVRNILLTLGATPLTKVKATAVIDVNRPSRNFFVTVTTATPIPRVEAKEPANKDHEGTHRTPDGQADPLKTDPFPAQWKTIELSRDRSSTGAGRLRAYGGLRKTCCRRSALKIVADRVSCAPNTSASRPGTDRLRAGGAAEGR